ncbi:MAG: hypothetical protein RR588_11335 [Solibacillus sp.]
MSKLNDEKDKPFNDAMEHLNKIEGYPLRKGRNLPLPLKIIGYFMFGGIIIMLALGLILSILN